MITLLITREVLMVFIATKFALILKMEIETGSDFPNDD